jgi:hypothetical protein
MVPEEPPTTSVSVPTEVGYLSLDASPLLAMIAVNDRLEFLHDIQSQISTVSRLSIVDTPIIQAIEALTSQIILDKSLINEIDLGPFKHKEDSGASIRKLSLACIDLIIKKFDPTYNQVEFRENVAQTDVPRVAVEAVLKSLDIDLSNSGDELYQITVSILESIVELNPQFVVDAIPSILDKLSSLISTCPVGKKGGDQESLNTVGVLFGHLILAVMDIVKLKADDNGVSLRTLVHQDYPKILDIFKAIDKDGGTLGSIMHATKVTLAHCKSVVV